MLERRLSQHIIHHHSPPRRALLQPFIAVVRVTALFRLMLVAEQGSQPPLTSLNQVQVKQRRRSMVVTAAVCHKSTKYSLTILTPMDSS
jgi:hypothetical protein